ncbi:MAG: CBS domain-containing protein [Verrucomicrobia bacterium]|nr:CBS domain-containing protein [Verrucomicrobiota bacterium]
MKIAGSVSVVLSNKGSSAWTVGPDDTVLKAITLMDEKNVGALLVTQGERLVGVVSERDYTRKVALKGRSSRETLVRQIMAVDPVTVTPETSVDECLHLMTDKRVRHLPVLEGDKVVGVVSIGDLVNWVISAQSATIDHLQAYISGHYPGMS